MVFGVKSIHIMMAQRLSSARYTSSIKALKDFTDQIMSRSHSVLSREDSRSTPKEYVMRFQNKWTSLTARIISVVLFVIAVLFCAAVIGLYYTYGYHPRTHRLFQKRH